MGALELRKAILEKTALLPENLLKEVYDFVEFLNLKQNQYLADLQEKLTGLYEVGNDSCGRRIPKIIKSCILVKEEMSEEIRVVTSDKYVADTMALVLWLENRKLPPKVKEVFENASVFLPYRNCIIWIPPIVLAEIGYLSEKGRIDTNLLEVEKYMIPPSVCNFRVPWNDFEAIKAAFEITDIP